MKKKEEEKVGGQGDRLIQLGKQTDKNIDRLDEENSDDIVYCYYIYRYIAITLTGVRFTDMIKRNGLSFSILETRNSQN